MSNPGKGREHAPAPKTLDETAQALSNSIAELLSILDRSEDDLCRAIRKDAKTLSDLTPDEQKGALSELEDELKNTPLRLLFAGALIEQLGSQLYSSATATVAELISNSWDADAKNVWVKIPFGEAWTDSSTIEVLDDGHGMNRKAAQLHYLVTGRKRRLSDRGTSRNGRAIHGRKGIGKLAAFGTAGLLECYTKSRHGDAAKFQLDYERIRKAKPGEVCDAEELDRNSVPKSFADKGLNSGTLIQLRRLRLKRAISEEKFRESMSRRFALNENEMKVFINEEPLRKFAIDLEFRYPCDKQPRGAAIKTAGGWGLETLEVGKDVEWWIGFTAKPLEDEAVRGVSVLSRGKLLQKPFLFGRSQGATGQLGQEYIVGEVKAEWLDTGVDADDDLVQTSRDQLQLEDERIEGFLEWGRKRIDWALSARLEARRSKAEKELDDPEIVKLLADCTAKERSVLLNIAKQSTKLGDPDPKAVHDFMVEVINGYKDRAVRELMEQVQIKNPEFQDEFWTLVREFSLIDARRNLSIIQARLSTIEKLENAVAHGASEVPVIHEMLKEFPWLIDPRWSLMGEEVDLKKFGIAPETDAGERGGRLDFVFALGPAEPAQQDRISVVEIKRGTTAEGKIRKVSDHEVQKFHKYLLHVERHFAKESQPRRVTGLMIADGYTEGADLVRVSLGQIDNPEFKFKTWDSVIRDTKQLHMSWLDVTTKASQAQASG